MDGIGPCRQDRVVQVYEGLVYMNLSTELLKSRGFGEYENIDIPLEELPQFFLVYLADPSDSGKIHNDVKMRWLNGDQQVVDAMTQVRLSSLLACDLPGILRRDHLHRLAALNSFAIAGTLSMRCIVIYTFSC